MLLFIVCFSSPVANYLQRVKEQVKSDFVFIITQFFLLATIELLSFYKRARNNKKMRKYIKTLM